MLEGVEVWLTGCCCVHSYTCAEFMSSPRPRWVHCCVSVVRWSAHTPSTLSWSQERSSALSVKTAVPDVEQQFKFTQVCVTPPQVFRHPLHLILGASFHSSPSSFLYFPHLSLLSFSPSPSYPTFPSPSMPLHITSSFHSILSTSLILFPSLLPPPLPPTILIGPI